MKFAYYKRLGARQRRIYDSSDAAGPVRVPGASELAPLVARVAGALSADDRRSTESSAQRLVDALLGRLHVQPVTLRVLAVRPSNHREELHGLYEYGGNRRQPVVSVWMRTAQRRQVVAFRTFMRTLLHEVVHHLDYQLLRLGDSYHTQGFYKRAESLYRQLVPEELATSATTRPAAERAAHAEQLAATTKPLRRTRPAPEPAPPFVATTPFPPEPVQSLAGPRPPAPRRSKRRAPAPEPQLLLPFMP